MLTKDSIHPLLPSQDSVVENVFVDDSNNALIPNWRSYLYHLGGWGFCGVFVWVHH
jgi:hypothetical protein